MGKCDGICTAFGGVLFPGERACEYGDACRAAIEEFVADSAIVTSAGAGANGAEECGGPFETAASQG